MRLQNDTSTTFDYVIVGAGSAGCVLANRLSEDPSATVCLIESGTSDRRFPVNAKSRIPAGGIMFRHDRRYNWLYPSESTAGPASRPILCPRGRLFGGTSSINGMIYMRGQPQDYDRWAALGNDGWSFADVLPFFRKSEHFEPGAGPLHGQGGELNVAAQRSPHPLSFAFVEAAGQCQFAINPDFNGDSQTGFGLFHVTQKNGERWSTARAFLHPALSRRNLHVESDATALHLTFDGKRASGLRLRRGEMEFSVRARRDVILSAGAIASPQLLMLSGIGPAGELRDLGITPLVDNPGVGGNFHDHCDVAIAVADRSATSYAMSARGLPGLLAAPFRYLQKRGPLTSIMVEAGGFIRSRPDVERPDLHFIFTPMLHDRAEYLPRGHGFMVHVSALRPKSRGRIRLRSADLSDPPLLRPNLLSHEDDLQLLIEGLRVARRIIAAPALAPFRSGELSPGSAVETQVQLADYVRGTVATVFHPVGTCKMGVDSLAVVDPSLRVHGIGGLRVIDASVMPEIVSGNTNAPTVMIAEKGAALIAASR
ncbi:GMC family oxidoreductase [Pseudorhodoplanes sp.]|uniref:GMC family oxidoreductase n=1 Tax=Pseudorhodoplanes sp. TaxID=1934341 RepID=UPI003D0B6898